jgi:hypothetical protein
VSKLSKETLRKFVREDCFKPALLDAELADIVDHCYDKLSKPRAVQHNADDLFHTAVLRLAAVESQFMTARQAMAKYSDKDLALPGHFNRICKMTARSDLGMKSLQTEYTEFVKTNRSTITGKPAAATVVDSAEI